METNNDAIRIVIENWAKAVRERDIDSILAHHSEDIVMYDLPDSLQEVGIESYRKTWDKFFNWSQDLGVFDIKDMHIVAGEDVAFCFAAMQCAGLGPKNIKEVLDFRLTIGLKKINNQWTVLHEHHSLPAM